MGAYQDLIADPADILGRLNPSASRPTANCPSTTAVVINYLDTGEIVAARPLIGGGFIIAEDGQQRNAPNIGSVIHRLQHLPSQSRMAVYGTIQTDIIIDEGRHHYFVLLKLDREVYMADAYTGALTTGEANICRDCSWMRSLQYWTGTFHVRWSPG